MFTAFIVLIVILAYVWLLYPGIVLLAPRKKKADQSLPELGDDAPLIAIVFSAHDEEKVIGARLANLTSLDYPYDRLAIVVGMDGCTDRTESIVREWASFDPRIHTARSDSCQGKTRMLKQLVEQVLKGRGGEGFSENPKASPSSTTQQPKNVLPPPHFLIFTDANTTFERDAVRWLVTPFSDPRVGGVCGKLVFVERGRDGIPNPESESQNGSDGPPSRSNEPAYWNWETRIKESESRLDSCLGANGAIYAIRSELFPLTMPDNVIIDDFVIGMKVREQGFRMVFEPAAVAREDLPESIQNEWRHRVRIGAGAFQALALCRACLSPRYGLFAWIFWSHKVLRWFTPHMLCAVVVIGCWFLARWGWKTEDYVVNLTAVGAMSAFVFCLVMAGLSPRFKKRLDQVVYFLTMQAALLAGFIKFCRGNLSGKWERTER
ncbi:MAG: glycosyltransferase family 2 protein [bacterium]